WASCCCRASRTWMPGGSPWPLSALWYSPCCCSPLWGRHCVTPWIPAWSRLPTRRDADGGDIVAVAGSFHRPWWQTGGGWAQPEPGPGRTAGPGGRIRLGQDGNGAIHYEAVGSSEHFGSDRISRQESAGASRTGD